jgi:hypothetical protein
MEKRAMTGFWNSWLIIIPMASTAVYLVIALSTSYRAYSLRQSKPKQNVQDYAKRVTLLLKEKEASEREYLHCARLIAEMRRELARYESHTVSVFEERRLKRRNEKLAFPLIKGSDLRNNQFSRESRKLFEERV